MTEKFNLSAEWAKNFGLYLEEAYDTMLVFSLENKFDCYPPERCIKPFITYQLNITFLSSVKEAVCVEVISLLRLKKNY